MKIKSFECPSQQLCQQPTVLFSIYQDNTLTIRCLVNEAINPATKQIIMKIVGYIEKRTEGERDNLARQIFGPTYSPVKRRSRHSI